MSVMNWNTTVIDGKSYLVIDVAKFRIPLDWDPSSNMFLAVAAPDGGIGNFPALLRGDDGDTPEIDNTIDFTPLDPDGDTPDYATWEEISPNVYKMHLGLRTGEKGDDGILILDPANYGTPVAGQMLVVNPTLDGFELTPRKVGDLWLPATIANAPTGNSAYTLAAVPVPAQGFDWRPDPRAQCVVTGTGADFRGDFFARLSTAGIINGETAGPEVGRGFGPIGTNAAGIATHITPTPPAGSADTYGKVLAANSAVIYFRVERQAGANTFSTVADTTRIGVKVDPCP